MMKGVGPRGERGWDSVMKGVEPHDEGVGPRDERGGTP